MTRARILVTLARFWRQQSGAVAVEFVLIAPILFSMILGVISLGYFTGVSHSLHQLAAGAARASVAGLDDTERASLANIYLSQAGSRYPLVSQENLTPVVTFVAGAPEGVRVDVTYDITGSLLDLANGFLKLGLTDMKGTAYVAY